MGNACCSQDMCQRGEAVDMPNPFAESFDDHPKTYPVNPFILHDEPSQRDGYTLADS